MSESKKKKKKVEEPVKSGFDASKYVANVTIPSDITVVYVTSDGQVFFPKNVELAKKHAAKKKLDVVEYKV